MKKRIGKRSLRGFICAAAITLRLLFPPNVSAETMDAPPARAVAGSVEVFAGEKNANLDEKLFTEIAPDTTLFIRYRPIVDYECKVISGGGYIQVSHPVVGGLGVFAETQIPSGKEGIPGIGVKYKTKIGNLGLIDDLSVILANGGDIAYFNHFMATYDHEIRDKVRLIVAGEDLTMFGSKGHISSIERARIGLGYGRYEAGLGVDLKTSKLDTDPVLGGVVKVNF